MEAIVYILCTYTLQFAIDNDYNICFLLELKHHFDMHTEPIMVRHNNCEIASHKYGLKKEISVISLC